MKLTKKLKAEIKSLMDDYWDSYFRGDLKHWKNYLVDDYRNIGGTEEEIWNSKKEILDYSSRIIDQMVGKAEIRNKKTQIIPYDPYVMVHEFMDLFIKVADKWTFYGKFRLSSLIKKTDDEWKVLHQHGSYPDSHTEQGEAFAFDKLRKENTQLREAVQRRTIELREKNNELQIEAALERVRTVAMGMKKPGDLLGVCKSGFRELKKLGFGDLRNMIIHTYMDEQKYFIDYDYSDTLNESISKVPYTGNPVIEKFIKTIRGDKAAFSEIRISGKQLENWKKFRKANKQPADPRLNKAKALYYYNYSIGSASIGISTFSSIDQDKKNILTRFRNVFDLCYRRYRDIEKAEAQAREAQVEVAVERVRARALAMHRSEDIHEVVRTLRNELFGLNLEGIIGSTICLQQSDGQVRLWDITDIETSGRYGWDILFDIGKIDPKLWVKKIWNASKQIISAEQDWNDLRRALTWLSRYDKKTAGEILKLLKTHKIKHGWHRAVKLANGRLITDFRNEPPAEIDSILLKMGAAFDLAYTRFLDLKKAEAQAREAKIEAALERTRTQSMIMQHSTELDDALRVFHEQVLLLGIKSEFSYLWLPDENKDRHIFWAAWAENFTNSDTEKNSSTVFKSKALNYPLDRNEPATAKCLVDWKSDEPVHSYYLPPGKEVKNYFASWKELLEGVERLKPKNFPGGIYYVEAFMKYGCFGVMIENGLSEEDKKVLYRFAIEFERTYTRFLDLQKAEAQAREAQVEAALEKVRARGMAMQTSEELGALIGTLFTELTKLDLALTRCVTWIIDPKTHDAVWWMANSEDPSHPMSYSIPYHQQPPWLAFIKEWKKQTVKWVYDLKGQTKKNWDDHLFSKTGLAKMPKFIRDGMKAPGRVLLSASFNNFGGINVASLEPLSDDHFTILLRFAKVFDLTYTRFNDLQKAEAQAREAQIEAALERVRARTMAMHQSDELSACAELLFRELTKLGGHLWSSGFAILQDDEEGEGEFRTTDEEGTREEVTYIPNRWDPTMDYLYAGWKQKDQYRSYDLGGKEIRKHYANMLALPKSGHVFRVVLDSGNRFPEWQQMHAAYFKQGYLLVISLNHYPYPELLIRFANVFEQTYTRFLDLKKAEAQSREAKIQLALERVRARSMAMHHSDELSDVVRLLYKEFDNLKLSNESTDIEIGLIDEETGIAKVWAHLYLSDGTISTFDFPLGQFEGTIHEFKKWKATPVEKRNELFFTSEFKGKFWNKFKTWIKKFPELAEAFQPMIEANISQWVTHNAYFSHGMFTLQGTETYSPETLDIQKRFTKVFEQTYTRFLDLKKAEAQAREAQIEAALEKVRSRTMGMQHSDELPEAANLLFLEVQALGIPAWSCGYNILAEDKKSCTCIMSSEGQLQSAFHLPFINSGEPSFAEWLEAIEKEEFFVQELSGKKIEDHYNYMKTLPQVGVVIKELENAGLSLPTYQINHLSFFSGGFLLFITYEPVPHAHSIFKRFTYVFEQTYTRFLDLQKAEAQAREAQIEASLERIRSRTMGMQKTEELKEIVALLYEESNKFGFASVLMILNTRREEDDGFNWWFSANEQTVLPQSYFIPDLDEPVLRDIKSIWESGKPDGYIQMGGDIKREHDRRLFSETGLRELPAQLKEMMRSYESVFISIANMKNGFIEVAANEFISEDQSNILQRYAKVFEQTYTRFLDLQKAEEQAREAEIQLALERVRARTMAMHKSEELQDVASLLYKEFQGLGVTSFLNCGYVEVDEEHKTQYGWMTSPDGTFMEKFHLPLTGEPAFQARYDAWKKQEPVYHQVIGGAALVKHIKVASRHFGSVEVEKMVKSQFPDPTIFYCGNFSKGYLHLVTGNLLTSDEESLLERFTRAFEMTYKRFLDLQKAEAQAREAQIEAALERVRSRTMGMQHSGELAETATVLFQQVKALGIPQWTCGFCIFEIDDKEMTWYPGGPNGEVLSPCKIPLWEHPVFIQMNESRKRGDELYVYEKTGEAQADHYRYMLSLPVIGEYLQSRLDAGDEIPRFQIDHLANFSHGNLVFITYEHFPEMHDIFKRFAKVFEQTYTRFLDLKKAEAQAREAKIEAALERVRSRSIAMRKSEEIADIVGKIFSELRQLNLVLNRVLIWTFNDSEKYITWWSANPEVESSAESYRIDYNDQPVFINFLEAWQQRKPVYLQTLSGDAKRKWEDHLFEHTEMSKLPMAVRKGMREEGAIFTTSVISDYGLMMVGSFEPLSEENIDIIQRFGRVFQQSYTRYLDVQKAEEQAREAEIQLALERVRARTMAMQKSDELKEVVQTLSTEIGKLDLIFTRTFIVVYEPDTLASTWWMSNPETKESFGLFVKYHEHAPYQAHLKAWRERNKAWQYILEGEDKKQWDQFLFHETDLSNLPVHVKADMQGKEKVCLSCSFSNFGYLVLESVSPLSDEQFSILFRFAKTFDLTYTRFLDIQKAETQAREAQIEVSLERVRARTMAMQKPEELDSVIKTVYAELKKLDVSFARCFIMIFDEQQGATWWMGSPDDELFHQGFYVPYHTHPPHLAYLKGWEERQQKWEYLLEGQVKKDWDEFIFNKTELSKLPLVAVRDMMSFDHACLAASFENFGCLTTGGIRPLSEESYNILGRFAKVFDLTYTRFLDLQKAEAQAREAQIEAALEKIRSRSLAMHHSNELKEVIAITFEKLNELNVLNGTVGIQLFDHQTKDSFLWVGNAIQQPQRVNLPYDEEMMLEETYVKDGWQAMINRADIINKEYSFEQKNKFFNYIFSSNDLTQVPETAREVLRNIQNHIVCLFPQKYSALFVDSFNGKAFSDDDIKIIKRAANVFEQAYIRFLDLQKAEAQAREAQIQLALERVRARTMAMHKSEELSEAAFVLFQQFKDLGEEPERIFIATFDEVEEGVIDLWGTNQGGNQLDKLFKVPANEPTMVSKIITAWKEKKKSVVIDLSGEELEKYLAFLSKAGIPVTPGVMTERRVQTIGCFSKGVIGITTPLPRPAESVALLERFAGVFNLTYTRFLDLKIAEAQAHEARIEISLERIRARALAMHKSVELIEVAKVLWEQMNLLGQRELEASAVHLYEVDPDHIHSYRAVSIGPDANTQLTYGHMAIPKNSCELVREWLEKFNSGSTEYTIELSGSKQDEWYDLLFKLAPDVADSMRQKKDFHEKRYYRFSKFSGGALLMISKEEASEEVSYLQKKAAIVFDLAYRRFADLQHAEAQAREAQIEASLERIRAKAMAMHSSNDLAETLGVFYRELKSLSVTPRRCGVAIMNRQSRMAELTTMNTTEEGDSIEVIGTIKMSGHPVLDGVFENWLTQKEFHVVLRGNQIKEYYQVLRPQISVPDYPHDMAQFGYYFMFREGDVYAWTDRELSEDDLKIFRRFTTVISLTYKRYKDLQIAEANAREAQIEASLERVRARTMAMHSSEDVSAATSVMFTELEKLGIENLRGGITIIKPDQTQEVWSITNMDDGTIIRSIGVFDMRLHPFWQQIFTAWLKKEDYTYYSLAGKDKEEYISLLNSTPDYLSQPIREIPDVHVQSYFFGEGAVWTNSLQPHTEEHKQIMKRFASVFSLTFRRYLDLKKAEAQTREAQIEAALERVRARAMAMHNSQDLADTIGVFYKELQLFSLTPRRCGVGLLDREEKIGELFTWNTTEQGESLELVGKLKLEGHPVLEGVYDHWLTQTEYHPVLRGNEIKEYYKVIRPHMAFPDYAHDAVQFGYFFFFKEGGVYAWTEKEMKESELQIYRRFTSVLSLTYKRFKELKQAEANAREAVRQASLDRVRAEIASMRTVEDLQRITPVIWKELTILNIPFIRCGIFIMDDARQLIHTFLSTPDGKAIASFHLPYDTPGNIGLVINNWRNKEQYIDHWDENEFHQFAEILVRQGALDSAANYLKTIPQSGFHLHFLPFLQGMLYVGNTEQLSQEQIELIQHVADAFSTAYARYEDFNKLEAAKRQVDQTLADLKQAQQQLVQSEKMASLGELTAGIAHEIQNPLNFVNNFSDVSNELLEEMRVELEKGNKDDAIAIVEDVKQNLEKILHHGKRADAIVKGMLQHSRTSSGQKEMTDINMLADEYLRLAYHGLRAKDKSFNARFETEFDNGIGKINIIPQDIGRVILNLINNAFYTVNEKKKHDTNGYEPTVTVITKKENGKIEIKVKDNGNGIPQKVLDKIFQPFFTTKPTGQGTGLGLSLAYDIITKGHGGELKVETREGEGSEFIIQLPTN